MRRCPRWRRGRSRGSNRGRMRLKRVVSRLGSRRGGRSRGRSRLRGRRGSTSDSSDSQAGKGSIRSLPWRMGLPVDARPARHLPLPSSIPYPSSTIRRPSNVTYSPLKIDSSSTWPILSSSSLNYIPSLIGSVISSRIRSTGKDWRRPTRGASSMSPSSPGYQGGAGRASWCQLWTARRTSATAISNST